MWKCNQSRPGFELVSPCSFSTTITITPRAHYLECLVHLTWMIFEKGRWVAVLFLILRLLLPVFVQNITQYPCVFPHVAFFPFVYLLITIKYHTIFIWVILTLRGQNIYRLSSNSGNTLPVLFSFRNLSPRAAHLHWTPKDKVSANLWGLGRPQKENAVRTKQFLEWHPHTLEWSGNIHDLVSKSAWVVGWKIKSFVPFHWRGKFIIDAQSSVDTVA